MITEDEDTKGIFRNVGLYSPIKIAITDNPFMINLRSQNVRFDCHCVWCNKNSTFRNMGPRGGGAGQHLEATWALKDRTFFVEVSCARNPVHTYVYVFDITNLILQKIGQFPSMETIGSQDIQRFRSILGTKLYSDLHRAGGLFSHGIGIGSFVYLRRVFEQLVIQARDEAIRDDLDVSSFDSVRMVEKIELLSSYLPPSLVKNKSIYGILSKGVHELDEETCKKFFPVVKAGIIQMLEQYLHKKEKAKAEQDLEKEIQRISSQLGSNNTDDTKDQ